MSDTAALGNSRELPKTLRITSLLKRAVVGMLLLIFGVLSAAWIFDASIKKPSARFAAPGLSTPHQQETHAQ